MRMASRSLHDDDDHDDDEPCRLPGELPPALRRQSYAANHAPRHHHSLCASLRVECAAEDDSNHMQETQLLQQDNDRDLFKVVERLDDITERLMKSCKVKPQLCLHMDAGVPMEEPFDSRALEDRLDKIIQKMSQSGYLSGLSKECYTTPTKEGAFNVQSASPPKTPSSGTHLLPPPTKDESEKAVTPTSSFKLPLLTPRSLLSKFGSAEKADVFDSPPDNKRLSSSGGRSRRFSAAFSFLSAPKRTGASLSFRLGSSKDADRHSER